MALKSTFFFFINLMLLTFGAGAVLPVMLLHWRQPSQTLKLYIRTHLTWTAQLFLMLFIYYAGHIFQVNNPIWNALLNDISYLLLAFFVYFLVHFLYLILNVDMTLAKKRRLALAVILIAVPISTIREFQAHPIFLNLIETAKVVTLYALFYYSSFFTYRNSAKLLEEKQRRFIRLIFWLSMICYPLILIDGWLIFEGINFFGISPIFIFYFLCNISFVIFAGGYIQLPEVHTVDEAATLVCFFQKYDISAREQEIVQLILRGHSYKEIATTLFISFETVKTHVGNIYRKAGIRGKMELVNQIKQA